MPNEPSFTSADLDRACDDLATIPFFPTESRASVMTTLRDMCPHKPALKWLVDEAKNHLTKWPGLAELRGILCTKFDPADGIDHWCTLPGYTAADAEAKHLEAHEQRKIQERVGGYIADESRELLRPLSSAKPKLLGNGKVS